jgi:hypothetical protein
VLSISSFRRELKILGALSLLFLGLQIFWFGASLRHPDILVEPGEIERDVTTLGGPCMAAKRWAYDKLGPVGIGECSAHFTNAARTAAKVKVQIFVRTFWASVTADTVTDGGPLASLNWRVTHGEQTPWQLIGDKT